MGGVTLKGTGIKKHRKNSYFVLKIVKMSNKKSKGSESKSKEFPRNVKTSGNDFDEILYSPE